MNNNTSIVATNYNGLAIATRTSDGWVNLTQMCKANGKRLDVYLKTQETKDYIASLEQELNYHQTVEVNSKPCSVMEKKEGRGGGTWGHPLLAVDLAQWIDKKFAVWCNAHIFVLMKDGVTTIDQNPFERMMQIMAEDYEDLDRLMPNDDRFGDIVQYSAWTLDEGEEF